MAIAIVGGTGPQGQGLALRLALAGVHLALGLRDTNRSESIVQELNKKLPSPKPRDKSMAAGINQVIGSRYDKRSLSVKNTLGSWCNLVDGLILRWKSTR